MFIDVSQNLIKLSKFFPENLYIVGGYVRNRLLGLRASDVDLCSKVDIEEVSKRLEGSGFSVKVKNLRLGSLAISIGDETYEYTAFRKEKYADDGSHTPISVERTDKVEEDSSRRDFSINAIYYNINKDECVDLQHGIVDLTDKIIRACTPDLFKNDGERVLRMVRIAGELGFEIEKNTFLAAKANASNVSALQGARKLAEIQKILECDRKHNLKKKQLKRTLLLLNRLELWQYLGLEKCFVKYHYVYKTEDRFLGLLIDMVNTAKPECLEVFLEKLLKEQFGLSTQEFKRIFVYLSGFYEAISGTKNKEYFFKYFEYWDNIKPLLHCKSKHLENKYNFFYKYIIEHGLTIKISDLKINEADIKENFEKIDKRNYSKILENLLSKVFDGKLANDKESLLKEIRKSF